MELDWINRTDEARPLDQDINPRHYPLGYWELRAHEYVGGPVEYYYLDKTEDGNWRLDLADENSAEDYMFFDELEEAKAVTQTIARMGGTK